MKSKYFNGFANYETGNIALWIENDDRILDLVPEVTSYKELLFKLHDNFIFETPDGVPYRSKQADVEALDSMLEDLQ